jgi:hypothetical protein
MLLAARIVVCFGVDTIQDNMYIYREHAVEHIQHSCLEAPNVSRMPVFPGLGQ